jgi:F-type H+-transporting ATPase subunit epsilon
MAEPYKFELVSPERLLVSESVESIVIPATEGEMTVMANHSPVMTTIKPGIVTVKTVSGKEDRYVVYGGFADILPDTCTLLAESATHVDALNKADIAARVERARADIGNAPDDQARTRAEEFLHHLSALGDAV